MVIRSQKNDITHDCAKPERAGPYANIETDVQQNRDEPGVGSEYRWSKMAGRRPGPDFHQG